MRTIEQIATDVFNGLPVSEDEQRTFFEKYGKAKSAKYGIKEPKKPQQQQQEDSK